MDGASDPSDCPVVSFLKNFDSKLFETGSLKSESPGAELGGLP